MEISNNEIAALLLKLQAIDENTHRAILLRLGTRVGVYVESIVSVYPDAKERSRPLIYTRTREDGSTYLSAFKSQKQQNYVWWLISSGKVPYKRTGLLGRSFSSQAVVNGRNLLVKVGSNLKYSKFVIDEDEQAAIHQNYWTPIQKDLRDHTDDIVKFAQKELTDITTAYFLP